MASGTSSVAWCPADAVEDRKIVAFCVDFQQVEVGDRMLVEELIAGREGNGHQTTRGTGARRGQRCRGAVAIIDRHRGDADVIGQRDGMDEDVRIVCHRSLKVGEGFGDGFDRMDCGVRKRMPGRARPRADIGSAVDNGQPAGGAEAA